MRSRRNLVVACVVVLTIFYFLYPASDTTFFIPRPDSDASAAQGGSKLKEAEAEAEANAPSDDEPAAATAPPPPPPPPHVPTAEELPLIPPSKSAHTGHGLGRPDSGLRTPADVAASFANYVETGTDRPVRAALDPLCAHFPGQNTDAAGKSDDPRIVVIVKTGASESFSKVPTQLQTILRCAPEVLIFSDMEQSMAGVHVRDSLDTVLPTVREAHDDFALYRAQRACRVSQADCTRNRKDKNKEGWNLDKYKNIHIAEKAYNLRPGFDWYVVIDADTYMFWTSLVAFLKRFNPAQKLFVGSVTYFKDFAFAHGGSGYAMSKGAMDDFVGKNPGVGNAYDKRVIDECCGDWMFAKAMQEISNITATNFFPTINGDKVWSLPFGPTHWCQPLATMHHVDSEEMSLFWEFETQMYLDRKAAAPAGAETRPILLYDMYKEYLLPRLVESRLDWDSISDDRILLGRPANEGEKGVVADEQKKKHEREGHESAAKCRAACEGSPDCFQFTFRDGRCGLSRSFKIGYPTAPPEEGDEVKRYESGWLTERIKAWAKKKGECKEIEWPVLKTSG